jgi:primosomal protein N' (replication factor Y)
MTKPTSPSQHSLWTESGELRTGPVARVTPVAALDKTYSYIVPDTLADAVQPGVRVEVPFGRRGKPRLGFCIDVSQAPWDTTLRPITRVLDGTPLLSTKLLELGTWLADYYCAPLGKTLEAMLPAAVRAKSGFRRVRHLRLVTPAPPLADDFKMTPKRQAVLDFLADRDGQATLDDLKHAGLASPAIRKALRDAGLITEHVTKEPAAAPDFDRPIAEPDFTLSSEQTAAIERIARCLDPPQFRVTLLFGVSGSGKTEVYVRAIRRVMDTSRQAILLVPEIALTTQTTLRLASRFHDVVVLHSGLTGAQRSLIWSEIARGLKRVVIGTRSAVFAPCPNLGLIVVDEEQESTFKNQQSPRFHTRDVAVKRGQIESIPVLLGSATPSLETWLNCQRYEHYERLRLSHRPAGQPLPTIEVVDMRGDQQERRAFSLLSRAMMRELGQTLERGEQAVLLLNRRGYATFLFCPRCRQRIVCPNCHASLTFHKTTGMARCHYCRTRLPVPDRCPNESCRGRLVRLGMGTQRVEEELARRFPNARTARADTDIMRKPAQYEALVHAFEARRIDVLVGTQMIAKGLDFPFVSFVGVVSADTALAIPDFRAAERTFQLITQVAGRAGRADAPGYVVVQTFAAEVPALRYAVKHDYEGFAASEMTQRRKLRLPPYGRLARLTLADPRDSKARVEADALAAFIRQTVQKHGLPLDCWGPNPCVLRRLRNLYRHEILLRADTAATLARAMQHVRHEPAFRPKVRQFIVDVDPVSLL